jgi:hypothetical protein
MSGRARWLVFLALTVLLAACAAGANGQLGTPDAQGTIAGFWLGLWHGMIAPISFIISLFTREVRVYEVHNVGRLYDFGFIFGLMISLGGGGRASRRSRGRI